MLLSLLFKSHWRQPCAMLLDRPAGIWSKFEQGRGLQAVQHPLVAAVITCSRGTDPVPLPEGL